jgi:hypothetical protein
MLVLCGKCDHRFEHIRYDMDSALSAVRHNYSPGGVDEITLTMAAIDSQFARYDPEISRLQSILADLHEKRARLQSYKECCSSVLSPVRKLPPEVLQNVFLACRSPEPNVIPVVGQVCRHWRDLVEGTPQLWSNISIGRTRFGFHQHYLNLVALFLKRSANRPLSLTIRQPADGRLVGLVSRHANRWHTLRLSSKDKAFYTSFGLNGRFLPTLEKLEILETATESPEEPIKILHHASNLRHVVLKNALEFWDLPWSQLTRLQYDVHATIDAVHVLRLCPRLEECAFDKLQVMADPDDPAILTLRPLRNLRSLRLAVDTVNHTQSAEAIMHTFLTALTSPSLTSLTIIGQWTPADLTGFLAQSQCQLAHLTLGPGYMKDDKIIDVLQILPSLSSLVLDADIGTTRQLQNRVITDKLLRRLIFYPDSDSVLPSLTSFSLKTSINFEHQVLLDVIESRWMPWVTELYGVAVSRIRVVDLEFWGRKEKLDPESVAVLRDLAVAGLRLSLQQGPEKISMLTESDP